MLCHSPNNLKGTIDNKNRKKERKDTQSDDPYNVEKGNASMTGNVTAVLHVL